VLRTRSRPMTPAGDAPQPADGEAQNRTGDTTIFSLARELRLFAAVSLRAGLGRIAGRPFAALRGPHVAHPLPTVAPARPRARARTSASANAAAAPTSQGHEAAANAARSRAAASTSPAVTSQRITRPPAGSRPRARRRSRPRPRTGAPRLGRPGCAPRSCSGRRPAGARRPRRARVGALQQLGGPAGQLAGVAWIAVHAVILPETTEPPGRGAPRSSGSRPGRQAATAAASGSGAAAGTSSPAPGPSSSRCT
jgi:hypothetical protein